MHKGRKLFFIAMVLMFLLSACDKGESADFQSQVKAQLILIQGDLSIYYENYALKATASQDLVFKMIIPPLKRPGWEETISFIAQAIPKTKGELPELCREAGEFYREIDSLDYDSATRGDFADICQRLYPYLERLSRHLDLALAEGVQPLGNEARPGEDPGKEGSNTNCPIPDSRWDGGKAKDTGGLETLNGYSIVFRGGFAYFGTTYDTTDFITQQGTKMTYTIEGSRITFRSVKDPRSVVMTYSGSTITDNADPEKCAFEAGYVFRKQ